MFSQDRKYQRQDNGSFVPVDEPDSLANEIQPKRHSLTYIVTNWTIINRISGFDQSKERELYTFDTDEAGSRSLKCTLENENRRLHAISEEGVTEISAPFQMEIKPIRKSEIEGYVYHRAATPDSTEDLLQEEALYGVLGIPSDRFEWIVKQLNNPQSVLQVSLTTTLYKEAIAWSFDDHWMEQDFCILSNENTPIVSYTILVGQGPGTMKIGEDASEDVDEAAWTEPPEPIAPPVIVPDKRLNYVIWLLAALLVAILIK